jgi:endoglucanase
VLLGALALVALVGRTGDRPERSPPAAESPPAAQPPTGRKASGYRRGVNVYTLLYLSSDPAYRGEPLSSYRFLASRGIDIIRLPFPWGKLQPTLGGPFDPTFEASLIREVRRIDAAGMQTVLDLHNSYRHPTSDGPLSIVDGISQADLDDVWLKLSRLFGDDPSIYAYDLMNEPYELPSRAIEEASQGLVTALRDAGDDTLLWIEGNEYSAVEDWTSNHPEPWIDDPADNHMYSAHSYIGGQDDNPIYPGDIEGDPRLKTLANLKVFTDWLDRYGQRGSIGELGWPSRSFNPSWQAWNRLYDAWYRAADAAGLDVTYFGATSAYDDHLFAYDAPENRFRPVPGISQAESQASVIEAHPSVPAR